MGCAVFVALMYGEKDQPFQAGALTDLELRFLQKELLFWTPECHDLVDMRSDSQLINAAILSTLKTNGDLIFYIFM